MKYGLVINGEFIKFVVLETDYKNTSFPILILPEHLPENVVQIHEVFCSLCPKDFMPVLQSPVYNEEMLRWEQVWKPIQIIRNFEKSKRINQR